MGHQRTPRINRDTMRRTRADLMFTIFYNLGGERSVKKAVEVYSRTRENNPNLPKLALATVTRYSIDYNWQARAATLDASIQHTTDADLVAVRRQINADALRDAAIVRGIAMRSIATIARTPEKQLEPDTALSWLTSADRLRRLAADMATTRTELVIQTYTSLAIDIRSMFLQVNAIADPEERKAAFAYGYDALVEAKLK